MVYQGQVINGVIVLEEGASLAEGVRVRVSPIDGTTEEETSQGETLGQRLLKYAGTAKGLPKDMARNHDHYLHGAPKR